MPLRARTSCVRDDLPEFPHLDKELINAAIKERLKKQQNSRYEDTRIALCNELASYKKQKKPRFNNRQFEMIANSLNCALEATSFIDEHGIACMMLALATTFHPNGLGTYSCKWLFNEDDIMLNNSAADLSIEEYDKICCLSIEKFQSEYVGEYQVVLSNVAGMAVKSKSIMCAVVDDNELQFNGIHEDNCVNHGQTHVVLEPLVIRTWSQNNTNDSIDRSLDAMSFESDKRGDTSTMRLCEIGMRW
ncbi:unnamed protein product [Rotaria socialis]|uniref:SBF1/SBF2 domain-containing protein n=2 Tax=Rotaria socialis TaxID=392032 RepID=A0A817YIP7_9BILA|nr:unnamed protein product [Rotaria socialis]